MMELPSSVLSALASRPIQGRMLGWLVHAVGPGHAISQRLSGVEDSEAWENLPVTTWRSLLLEAAESMPGTSEAERLFELGVRVAAAFVASELGALVLQSLRGAPPERYVSTLPKVFALSRSDVHTEVRPAPEGGWLIVTENPEPVPDFLAGAVQGFMSNGVANPQVAVIERSSAGFTLHARW